MAREWQTHRMTESTVSEKWTRVGLRVMSKNFTCGDITARLGLEPTKCFEKGSLAVSNNPRSYRLKTAVWLLESGVDSDRDATEHFEALLPALEDRQGQL